MAETSPVLGTIYDVTGEQLRPGPEWPTVANRARDMGPDAIKALGAALTVTSVNHEGPRTDLNKTGYAFGDAAQPPFDGAELGFLLDGMNQADPRAMYFDLFNTTDFGGNF